MRFVKMRERAAAAFALILVIFLAAVGAAVAGWDIPGLSYITDALGIGNK